jgi:hypothetical protein
MPTTAVDPHGWTTSAEPQFIAGMAGRDNAIECLRGYVRGMQKRANASGIDAQLCITVAQEHLDEQLAILTGGRRVARFI